MSQIRDEINKYKDFLYQQPRTIMQAMANAAAAAAVSGTHKDSGNAAANWNVETTGVRGGAGVREKAFAEKHGTEGVGQKGDKGKAAGQTNKATISRLTQEIHQAIWNKDQTRIVMANLVPELVEGRSGSHHLNAMVDEVVDPSLAAAGKAALARAQAVKGYGMGYDWSKVGV